MTIEAERPPGSTLVSRPTQRASLFFLTGAAILILSSFFLDHELSSWTFALLATTFPFALILVGVGQKKSPVWLTAAFILAFVSCSGSMLVMLLVSGSGNQFGLAFPISTYFLTIGIWIFPLIITSYAYAGSFQRLGVDDAMIAEMNERHHSLTHNE